MKPDKIIYRESYKRQISPFINTNLIKVLIGQRRVGKSYILYQIMEDIKKDNPEAQIIYIDKEDYAFDSIRNYSDLINHINNEVKPDKRTYLFIDEIQDITEFEKALRHFQSNGNFDIYCTGSNAHLLSSEIATLLAGRYIQIRIFSLSYSEFLEFHNRIDSNESLMKYIRYGGLPNLKNLAIENDVYIEYLKNVFDSIILRDIVTRYNIRNIRFLQDLIRFVADNTASIVSANKISEYLKSQRINISTKQILELLNKLESVFFIDRVRRIDIIGKKIFEVGDKFYFEDLGLRHAIIPYSQKDINKVMENLIYHQLKVLGYDVYIGKLNGWEIDFVAEKSGSRIYIQSAYIIGEEKTFEREFGNLLKIEDNFPKYVITMDETIGSDYKGIKHIHIREFLMNRV